MTKEKEMAYKKALEFLRDGFDCGQCGVNCTNRECHVDYIAEWLEKEAQKELNTPKPVKKRYVCPNCNSTNIDDFECFDCGQLLRWDRE